MSEKTLVIGGGISGLLTANLLKAHSIAFTGLEKTERLGGRAVTGHHRLYKDETRQLLERFIPSLQWNTVADAPTERKKSEWQAISGEFSEEEQFYLETNFQIPTEPFNTLVDKLAANVSDQFLFQHSITEIRPDTKTVLCQTGATFEYDRIIWCHSLTNLLRVWQGDKLPLIQAMKNVGDSMGRINLDWELSSALFPHKNTVVFPFRYKSFALKALGVQEDKRLHWMLFLKKELGEDREEIAKVVRALKRELQKEFAELKALVVGERIGYFSPLSGEGQANLAQQEILPGVFYVGAHGFAAGSDESLRSLDRIASNCLELEKALSQSDTTPEVSTVEDTAPTATT